MTFELFDEPRDVAPVAPVTPVMPNAAKQHTEARSESPLMTRLALTIGGSLLAIGGAVGGATSAIALEETIEPKQNEPEQNEQTSLEQAPINPPVLSNTSTLGAMLPADTIATVIVDTVGDWQAINQFDLLAEPIEGFNADFFSLYIPNLYRPAALDGWSGDQIALASLPSDRAENGGYGIAIVPLAEDVSAAANAQSYRDELATLWSNQNAATGTQIYRGIDILVLFKPSPVEPEPLDLPVFDIDNPPSEITPISQVKQSTAVDRPDPSAANDPEMIDPPSDPETIEPIAPVLESAPQVEYAIAQLDDRLLFASSVDDLTYYIDALNLGDPLAATLPPLTSPLDSDLDTDLDADLDADLDTPSEAIAAEIVDAIDLETVENLSNLVVEPLSLSDVPAFQDAIAREPENAAAIVYADMPRLLQALGKQPLFSMLPSGDIETTLTPAEILNTLDTGISTLDGFLWFDPSGARMQFRANYTDPQPQLAALARADDETLRHIPAASAMALTTRGFDVILPELLAVYDAIPEFQEPLNQAREEIRNAVGFDLDADILPLLDGDMSLFVFPSDRGFIPGFPGAFPLVVGITIETSDRPKMEALVTQLETLLLEQISGEDNINLAAINVEGFDVASWEITSPTMQGAVSLMGYTWVSDDTLLITTGAGLMADLLPTPYQSLLDSYTYQSAIEPFPQPNISLFHMNVGSILSLLNAYFPVSAWGSPSDTFDLPRFVQSFRSISESTTATENYAQDDIHIQLAPRRSE